MLDRNRVDLVVQSRIDGEAVVLNMGLKGIYTLEPPLLTVPVFHHLHRKHAHLVPRLTEILNGMMREGLLDH